MRNGKRDLRRVQSSRQVQWGRRWSIWRRKANKWRSETNGLIYKRKTEVEAETKIWAWWIGWRDWVDTQRKAFRGNRWLLRDYLEIRWWWKPWSRTFRWRNSWKTSLWRAGIEGVRRRRGRSFDCEENKRISLCWNYVEVKILQREKAWGKGRKWRVDWSTEWITERYLTTFRQKAF